MSKDNGGPAFPCDYEGSTRSDACGLSIRDYFAAKAMQGMLAAPVLASSDQFMLARDAYTVADAMLKERCKS